jgi:hypothetical protein
MPVAPLAQFVEALPEGGPEREYCAALSTIVQVPEADLRSVESGLGLLRFLNSYDFVGAGIDTTTHPAAGSDLFNATFVAHLFYPVGKRPEWWKQRALSSVSDVHTDAWRSRFAESTQVEKVYPPYET